AGVVPNGFPLLMEAPVVVPVAVRVQRAQLEDRLGAGEAPARAGDAAPVLNEVPAGSLDDAGCDGQARSEILRVSHPGGVAGEVSDAVVDGLALGPGDAR